MNELPIYINKNFHPDYGCQLHTRRICDSYYIKRYENLKKIYNKLCDDYTRLQEEKDSLEQLCFVYQAQLKGGEYDGKGRYDINK